MKILESIMAYQDATDIGGHTSEGPYMNKKHPSGERCEAGKNELIEEIYILGLFCI